MESRTSTNIPTFIVVRSDDLTLHFDPPLGSVALINALAIRYPLEPNLESQLRRALLEFITTESLDRGQPASTESPPVLSYNKDQVSLDGVVLTPPLASSSSPEHATSKPRQQPPGRKSRYTIKKRLKVAEVRKQGACAYHREKKLECNCLFQKLPGTPEIGFSAMDTETTPPPHLQIQGDNTQDFSHESQFEPTVIQGENRGNDFTFYNFDPDLPSSGDMSGCSQLPTSSIDYSFPSPQATTPPAWHTTSWQGL